MFVFPVKKSLKVIVGILNKMRIVVKCECAPCKTMRKYGLRLHWLIRRRRLSGWRFARLQPIRRTHAVASVSQTTMTAHVDIRAEHFGAERAGVAKERTAVFKFQWSLHVHIFVIVFVNWMNFMNKRRSWTLFLWLCTRICITLHIGILMSWLRSSATPILLDVPHESFPQCKGRAATRTSVVTALVAF